jgi:hypothetical protein
VLVPRLACCGNSATRSGLAPMSTARFAVQSRTDPAKEDTAVTTTLLPADDIRTPMSFDRDYWLSHCEGFRVETSGGPLGFVEELRAGVDGHGDMLAVRAGLLGRRVVLVPVTEVDFIVPRAERIWLHSPVTIQDSESAVVQR